MLGEFIEDNLVSGIYDIMYVICVSYGMYCLMLLITFILEARIFFRYFLGIRACVHLFFRGMFVEDSFCVGGWGGAVLLSRRLHCFPLYGGEYFAQDLRVVGVAL